MASAHELPTGTATFLFTDIEGSTRMVQELGQRWLGVLEDHNRILREAIVPNQGRVPRTEGDAFFAIFPSAVRAVAAAVAAQHALHAHPWPEGVALKVRIGLHTGEGLLGGDDYVGLDVHRAARIAAAAHGGQVLVSQATAALVEQALPPGVGLRDLGEHRLKDLAHPERLYQLEIEGLPRLFPRPRTLEARPNNLPLQLTSFIGRERELAEARRQLKATRLLTLTGPGGTGKTRLSLQVAAEALDDFPDGAYFVPLAHVSDPELVAITIVQVLGVRDAGDRDPKQRLQEYVRDTRLLLVLDNFEQLLPAASFVGDLLRSGPGLKVLVTSRAPLNVSGERVFQVPPLGLPDPHRLPDDLQVLTHYEAVQLFIERAMAVKPDFQVTNANAPAVAAICAHLDGLPLALELAAARVRLLSPEALLARLEHRLGLLGGGPRDLPARQRTLRDTIAWSYELLEAEERALFRLLAVFSPTRVEAVEDVVSRIESLRDMDVVDRLTSLVDKSLVRNLEAAGRQQLSMLETIREYATDRLDEDASLAMTSRQEHARYFADFAYSQRDRLYGSDRQRTLEELASEIGNLMTAWRYWVAAGDLEQLNRLLDSLWVLYDARGWYHAAVELSNGLLGVLSAAPETPDRLREEITLRTSLARGLSAIRGYTEEVEKTYTHALTLSQQAGALPQRLPVLRSIASFYLYRGEFDKTATVGRELLELAERQADVAFQVEGHTVVGSALAFSGDVCAGTDHLERAIALFDPRRGSRRFHLGPSAGVSASTTSALLLWLTGHPQRAVERASNGLDLARQMQHPFTLVYALFHVSFLDLWRGELQLAFERASAALELAEEHDYQVWRAITRIVQGMAMTGLGRPEEGLVRTEKGVAMYQGLKTPPVFWPLVQYVRARAFILAGRPTEGLELIREGIAMVGQGILYPEFAVLNGDLLLALADPNAAERWFRSGLDVARKLRFRTSELRAAIRLAELDAPDAIQLLRGAYEGFDEASDTLDLIAARAILAEKARRP